MTIKTIRQIHAKVISLTNASRNLGICNAYIDQALMNFAYETMTIKDQNECFELIGQMVRKFNQIRGR